LDVNMSLAQVPQYFPHIRFLALVITQCDAAQHFYSFIIEIKNECGTSDEYACICTYTHAQTKEFINRRNADGRGCHAYMCT
jgi:hypothetical protein